MGIVIGLSAVLGKRYAAAAHQRGLGHTQMSFSRRDRADLDGWALEGRRAVVVACEMGMFAMLHEDGQACASWGIVRQPRGLLVWNCVTLADVDRYAAMAEALAALDGGTAAAPVGNVVSFAARRAMAHPAERVRPETLSPRSIVRTAR